MPDASAIGDLARVAEATVSHGDLDSRLKGARDPFVVRGLVASWPLVEAGRRSATEARDYLLRHARNRPFTASVSTAESGGRLFYDEAMQVNFRTVKAPLQQLFAEFERAEKTAETIYLGSIDVHAFFDGLDEANRVELGERSPLTSIWIGTPTRVPAHNDFPDNLACVAVGRRRFTLFPPDQFANLYLGPLDNTPAGRAVSMVDFDAPDFDAHPRFREALLHAQVAVLEPGDAIFIPSTWWHHVEALAPFNVLVNYWWRDTPRWLGQPQEALTHAILAIRDLPDHEKAHWRALFDHYVFGDPEDAAAHIPPQARSLLAPLTPESAGRIRSFLLRALGQ